MKKHDFATEKSNGRYSGTGILVAVLMLPLLSGCSGKSSSKKTTPESSSPITTIENKLFKKKKSAKRQKITNVPKPVEAIRKLIEGLAENRPVAFWNALPESYQSDMNAYLHVFASRMDSELWGDVMGLLKRVEQILKSKKKFALEATKSSLPQNVDLETIEDLWDGYVELLEIILTSDFADLKKLKRADLGTILRENGGNTMNLLAAISSILGNDSLYYFQENLASLRVELLRSDHQSATLRFTDKTSRNKPFQQQYVLVEEKWVPIQWSQNWKRGIERLNSRLNSQLSPANIALTKKSMKEFHTKIDPVLTQLENAKSGEDFQTILRETGIATWLIARFPTKSKTPIVKSTIPEKTVEKKDSAKKRSYKIVIVDSVTAKEAEQFADTFFELIADIDIAPPRERAGTTTFTVDTKASFTSILEKLSFVEIVKTDETKGIIEIRLKK